MIAQLHKENIILEANLYAFSEFLFTKLYIEIEIKQCQIASTMSTLHHYLKYF